MADRIEDFEVNSPRWLSLEDFEGEVWKDTEYQYYKISNCGRLKRLAHYTTFVDKNGITRTFFFRDKIDKYHIDKQGYCRFRVHLTNGKKKEIKAHRLVAIAFIENPKNYKVINHIDENTSNNCHWNLEWCDQKYNTNYGNAGYKRTKGLIASYEGRRHIIKQYSLDGQLLQEFHGSKAIKDAGFNYSGVNASCNHIQHISQGFVWRFDDDPFSLTQKYGNGHPRKVMQFSIEGKLINIFNSIRDAEEAVIKYHSNSIRKCCNGITQTAYGYIWKFKD